MWLTHWEPRLAAFAAERLPAHDPAHDLAHVQRVVANARALMSVEGAEPHVVIPAAWLHDCVVLPKDSDKRSQASRLAATAAVDFLEAQAYPSEFLPAIHHAIEAHSFSAAIPPLTLEAKVVQDADRLDAIGAIGIARCLLLGGVMGKTLYDLDEPFPQTRKPDDSRYTLDHFYVKLLKLAEMMQTPTGRREGRRRTSVMSAYLSELGRELNGFVRDRSTEA
jgi:uncharacterized protein